MGNWYKRKLNGKRGGNAPFVVVAAASCPVRMDHRSPPIRERARLAKRSPDMVQATPVPLDCGALEQLEREVLIALALSIAVLTG